MYFIFSILLCLTCVTCHSLAAQEENRSSRLVNQVSLLHLVKIKDVQLRVMRNSLAHHALPISQRLFLLYVVSNSGKRYWDCKLPCIEAQTELSSTFVYDQKMSTSGSSARNSHLSQGGRMTMMPMSDICCFSQSFAAIASKTKRL